MENSIVKCLIRHENMWNQSLHNYGVKRWWNDIDAISTQCIKCSTQIKTDMHLTLKFISKLVNRRYERYQYYTCTHCLEYISN